MLFRADQQQAEAAHHQPKMIGANVGHGQPADVRHDGYRYEYYSNDFKDRSRFVAHV